MKRTKTEQAQTPFLTNQDVARIANMWVALNPNKNAAFGAFVDVETGEAAVSVAGSDKGLYEAIRDIMGVSDRFRETVLRAAAEYQLPTSQSNKVC